MSNSNTEKQRKRQLCAGLAAHVDAGKTTLAEALLYTAGALRSPGRVDHGNSFLDTDDIERERGITIFSKQARLETPEASITLLDTPGHVDFSAEAERAMHVIDCAILVISASDGVQAHTETLWQALERYRIPVFLFITKMDLLAADREGLMRTLKSRLSENCVAFSPEPDPEELALCSESLLEQHLSDSLNGAALRQAIAAREVYPCFFGSGLKIQGIEEFLSALARFAPEQEWGQDFGARVYKIARDTQDRRMTFLRVTGGSLHVRDSLAYTGAGGKEICEKITEIRLYSGRRYTTAETVDAGGLCAVLGLSATSAGQGLGTEPDAPAPLLEPVLSYRLGLPEGLDPIRALAKLRRLEEEDPQLHLVWNPQLREIHAQLMGQIQIEVLRRRAKELFDLDLSVGSGRILYRETIAAAVEGVGHYEPLRHYAEVHLLLTPLERGAGLVFSAACPEDRLDRNWQRLILTHLAEKRHLGVLTGSPVTDLSITLMSGRAHLKHTEGGDFRQATYRAVRQGLMRAVSVLLEPWVSFRLEIPPEYLGRAISDLRAMDGVFDSPAEENGLSVLKGEAPLAKTRDYALTLAAYSGGRGRFTARPAGFLPCLDQEAVVKAIGYEPERDLENTPDSVFCAHGGGFTVKWDRVESYMHLESCLAPERRGESRPVRSFSIDDRELEAIMEREFGPVRRPLYRSPASAAAVLEPGYAPPKRQFLIVDGYNVIFAWEDLKKLAEDNLSLARRRLVDILANYRAFTGCDLALVFDAYRVKGGLGEKSDRGGIHVVYTRENETGDAYIEKLAHDIGRNFSVRVVSSDGLIQLSAVRAGVLRVSAREFRAEVQWVLDQIGSVLEQTNAAAHTSKLSEAVSREHN